MDAVMLIGGKKLKSQLQLVKIEHTIGDSKQTIYLCSTCSKVPVDKLGGYDTCPECTALNK